MPIFPACVENRTPFPHRADRITAMSVSQSSTVIDSPAGVATCVDLSLERSGADKLSTPSAINLPRFACRTTIAAQSIRRKPCGQQIVKPACSCLTFKNQNHTRLALLRSQLAAAIFLRKSDTVNNGNPAADSDPAARSWRHVQGGNKTRYCFSML